MKQTTDSIQQEVSSCCLCGVIETNGHIFFPCNIARTIWFSFKEALGWDRTPQSMQDVFYYWIPIGGRDYRIKLFIFVIVLWGLWNIRNKMGIEKKFQGLLMRFSIKSSLLLRNGVSFWRTAMLGSWMTGLEEWSPGWWFSGSARLTWRLKEFFEVFWSSLEWGLVSVLVSSCASLLLL